MLLAVCLQQDSSVQKCSKDLNCVLLSLSEKGVLGLWASACVNLFIDVQQESPRFGHNEVKKLKSSGHRSEPHFQSLRVWRVWLLLPSFLAPGSWNLHFFLNVRRHQAWVLPAGKAAPSASILKTERTWRWPPPPPGRLVIVSTQWTADMLHEITATPWWITKRYIARKVGCLPGMCPCDYHQEAPDNKGVIGWGSERSGTEGEGGRMAGMSEQTQRDSVDRSARIRAEGTRSRMTTVIIDAQEGKRRSRRVANLLAVQCLLWCVKS